MSVSNTRKTTTNRFNIRLSKRPTADPLDHGLESDEIGFRWISARREEDRLGRIWQPLRKEHLTDEAQNAVKKRMYDVWESGNSIRRGDLVLAFAPKEMIAKLKEDNRQRAQQQEALVRQSTSRNGMKQEATVQKGGVNDFI